MAPPKGVTTERVYAGVAITGNAPEKILVPIGIGHNGITHNTQKRKNSIRGNDIGRREKPSFNTTSFGEKNATSTVCEKPFSSEMNTDAVSVGRKRIYWYIIVIGAVELSNPIMISQTFSPFVMLAMSEYTFLARGLGKRRSIMGNLSKLFQDGILISLSVSYWRGKKALTAKDLGLKPQDVPSIFSLGRKCLIPRDVIARFRSVEEKAAYTIEGASFTFPIGNLKFLPRAQVQSTVESLEQYRTEFLELVELFYKHYDEYRERMMHEYPQHRKALEAHYPAVKQLKRSFNFGYDLFEIALPNGNIKQSKTSVEKLDKEAKAKAVAEERYHAQIRAKVDGFLEGVVSELRQKTTDLCGHVAKKIAKGELVTEATVRSLRDWIEKFEQMNFTGDQTVSQQLASLKKALGSRSAAEYREDETAAALLGQALNTVVQAVSKLGDVSSVTGAYKRKLDF